MKLTATKATLAALLALAGMPLAANAQHDARPTGGTLGNVSAEPTAAPPVYGKGSKGFAGTPGNRPPITLDAYGSVAYAINHAPTLLSQLATVESLDSNFTKARAAEYPTAYGQLENQIVKQSNSVGAFGQIGLTPQSVFSENTAQLGSSYTLYNGTAQLTAEQAKRQVENAEYELRRQEEHTAADVISAFYLLAADRGTVTLDENDLQYQQTLLATAQAEEHVGRVAGVDVLRAQVAVTRSQSALLQARVSEQNDREALAVLIGAPYNSVFDVPDTLPEPPLPTTASDQLATIAKMNRPEISEARAALQAARLGDAAVDSDLRPTVQLTGAFGSQVSPTLFNEEQQEIDASNAQAQASYASEKLLFPNTFIAPPTLLPPVDRHAPGFWQFSILSNFQIPIYDYGQRAALHHAERAEIRSALASLYNAYDTVQADVDTADRNLQSTAQKLALAKQAAEQAEESARIAQLQYRSGIISFTDVTQTEQTTLAAENDLLYARVQYVTAFIKLRIALAPPDTAAAADLREL